MGSDAFTTPRVLHIVQGQVAVSMDPRVTYTTVLGACVAVCVFDEQEKLGGMAHFMFPDGEDYALDETRFCCQAITSLISQIRKLSGNANPLCASLFGAAQSQDGRQSIGLSNAESALAFLKAQGISVLMQALGGDQVRRIRFSPTTGHCVARSLNDGLPNEALASFEGVEEC